MNANLYIVSAPSGAGKSTLCRKLREKMPDINYSISYTTRKARKNETHGVDYFFISKEEFQEGIKNNLWAEWAEVHDNYYGTSRTYIESQLAKGNDVLLEIDVQGMRQIIISFPDAITIFIKPPSMEVLRQRLESRGTDKQEVIEKRLKNALKEMESQDLYQHHIVNDNLEVASKKFISLFKY